MFDDPDLNFCGFSVWIDQRQFPGSSEFWDSNWLMVRARMEARGASVECAGPILMTTDVKRFRDQLVLMYDTLAGKATLRGLEPEINVVLTMQTQGHVEGTIEITPDHLNQLHRFTVGSDQTYLPELVRFCDNILDRFPIINAETPKRP